MNRQASFSAAGRGGHLLFLISASPRRPIFLSSPIFNRYTEQTTRDPATIVGLALAVPPLIVAALENWEYTFQPIIIFSRRYHREVERFQRSLKVQRALFANGCCFLLHDVIYNRGSIIINDRNDPPWKDSGLEARLKARLEDSYDACVSALRSINTVLNEILSETKTLEILLQQVRLL